MPAEPAADWHAERSCPVCWTTFTPTGPQHRYCSDRCRKSAYARRHAPAPPRSEPAEQQRGPAPVAVRACPHCGSEIRIVALLTTREAARPAIPEPAVIPLRRA